MGLALGIVLECDLIVAATGTKFQVTETSEALTHRWRPFLSRLPSSCLTLRRREMDSNYRSPCVGGRFRTTGTSGDRGFRAGRHGAYPGAD